jgi:Ca-activated chloride channel family protein
MSAVFILVCCAGGAHAQQAADGPNGRVMMILDGSNSMWGRLQGEPKISIAKEVMTDLITDWDDDVPLGLMIYGHRRKKDCQDIELVALPGKADRRTLIDKVQSISPRGKTPISLSLITAKAQLLLQRVQDPSISRDAKTALVLVSDGLETCNADPCARAHELEVTDPGMDVHVIGFDVTDEESRALQCISDNTGGKFFRANNASELQAALKETVKLASAKPVAKAAAASPSPAPVPAAEPAKPEPSQFVYAKFCETCARIGADKVAWNIFKDGAPFFQGLGVLYPDDPVLTPGTYEVAARYQSSVVTAKGTIEIGPDGKQVGALNLNGGSARLFAYATDDKTIPAAPIFYRFFPVVDGKAADKGLTENASSDSITWLPAGRYKVVASHEQVTESAEIEIVAGQETRYDFDMRVGYFQPSAVLTPGGKPLGGDVDFFVYGTENAAKNASPLDSIVSGPSGDKKPLKPGTYFVKAYVGYRGGLNSMTRIFSFEVKANEVTAPVFDMQAGALSHTVTSKAGNRIINIDYVRQSDSARVHYYNAGSSNTLALPTGAYFLRVMVSGGKTFDTDPFEIAAGRTTTVNVSIP